MEELEQRIVELGVTISERDAQIVELAEALTQSRRLESEVKETARLLQIQVEMLKQRLAKFELPNMVTLLNELAAVGFYTWACEAAIQAESQINAVEAIAAMKAESVKPVPDPAVLKANFYKLAKIKRPTQAQMVAWQGVLDALNIPRELLKFIP